MTRTVSMTAEEIIRDFAGRPGSEELRAYVRFHSRRYERLLSDIDGLVQDFGKKVKLLDIGVSTQTEILRRKMADAVVNSMGLFEGHGALCRPQDRHFVFDLNNAGVRRIEPVQHDLVIFAEVLEHLHVSPRKVFRMLNEWLLPGGILLVQTPNACALHKRIAMLSGRNPFDMIRDDSENPGHFREYTLRELIKTGEETGFELNRYSVRNYFTAGSIIHKAYNLVCGVLPESFREGITISFRKTA